MMQQKSILTRLRTFAHYPYQQLVRLYYVHLWGMSIGKGTRIARACKLDLTNPRGVHIGEYTAITMHSIILTHDFVNGVHKDVYIGSYCFIGCGAIILPGVTIGDHCIVAANALVVRDVPSNTVVIGNPAFVAERGIETTKWGRRIVKTKKLDPAAQDSES